MGNDASFITLRDRIVIASSRPHQPARAALALSVPTQPRQGRLFERLALFLEARLSRRAISPLDLRPLLADRCHILVRP